jgi:hypothetical protein
MKEIDRCRELEEEVENLESYLDMAEKQRDELQEQLNQS